jgi:hypothetical protein
MLAGLPDLGVPMRHLPGLVFAAFGKNGVAVVFPDRIMLDRAPDGTPALALTFLRGGPTATRQGARLELGLSAVADLEAAGAALTEAGEPARLIMAEPEHGVLAVDARLGPVAPETLLPATELAPDVIGRARVVAYLTPEAALVAEQLIADATLPVGATLRLSLLGVAPRLPLAITIDPHAAAAELAGRLGEGAELGLDGLAHAMDGLAGLSSTKIEGDPAVLDPSVWTPVLAMRLQGRLATEVAATAPAWKLRAAADVPAGQERIDLAAPAAVIIHVVLALDPLAAARAVTGGSLDGIVQRVDVPPMPFGRTRVTLTANLPEPVSDLVALFADLRAPAAPPSRLQPVNTSVRLAAPDRTASADIPLAPGERLSGEVRLRAVIDSEAGPQELEGPWRPTSQTDMTLGPDRFPVPLTTVRTSAALTAMAGTEISTPAGRIVARLDAATPFVALPRLSEAPLEIAVRPKEQGRVIHIKLDSRRRLDLDPTMLDGFGAHMAKVTGTFVPGSSPVIVQWQAEGNLGGALSAVLLGSDQPSADIRWLATSPFRPGMVWRTVRVGEPGAWSEPVMPGDDLVISIDRTEPMGANGTSLVVDGIELRPDPVDSATWIYLPPGPLLDRGPDGKPLIALIEAGALAFLQITARIDLTEAARAALLARLKEKEPAARAIRVMIVTVSRVLLEVRDDASGWGKVAEVTCSGHPPWTAAIAATVTGAQIAAVKSALSGTKARLRLSATITLPAVPHKERREWRSFELGAADVAGSASLGVESTVASSGTPSPAKSIARAHDVADLLASM